MSGELVPDWASLSRDAGLPMAGDAIDVSFGDNRRQTVHVEVQRDGSLRLWSTVARPSALRLLQTPQLDAWHRNRLSEFVGFHVDRRGRMVGEAWVPPGPVTGDEWAFYVNGLARACDRYEYLLTGRDES